MAYKIWIVFSYTKKWLINIKSFKLSLPLILYIVLNIWLYFLWLIYIGILVFYTKLTHLTQKLKKLRLDGTYDGKLSSN